MQVSSKTTIVSAEPAIASITLDVGGMKCAGCVKAVERQLTQQPGVLAARVNLATEVAAVEYEPENIAPAQLAEKLTAAGFPTEARSLQSGEDPFRKQRDRQRQEIRQQIWRLAIAAILILLSGVGHLGNLGILSQIEFHWALATIALLVPARSILIDGWRGLWHGAPNMNTLVGLGSVSAYLASCVALLFPELGWECFFDEPVMLLGFILLGRTLEQLARQRAAASLQALVALKPATAHVLPNSLEEDNAAHHPPIDIPCDRVKVGEHLQVLPGEKIPVDGELVTGTTTVDESMLTGEAIAIAKQPGDTLTGGTLNQSGAIAMRATRTGSDTTLAHIIALVEEAQTRKAPVQQLADTVAGYFTYGVITIATLTFLFWYFAGTQIWPQVLLPGMHLGATPLHGMAQGNSPILLSLKLAIAVLVIACPCSLGLATPTALLVGTGLGAQKGLLIRGGDILERVAQLDTVIFDKTGTLTTGHPQVTDCISAVDSGVDSGSDSSLLQIAATVETGAKHPLAEAIVRAAQESGVELLAGEAFHTAPGLGVSAVVDGAMVAIGTEKWMAQHGVTLSPDWISRGMDLAQSGKTLVYVAREKELLGLIAARDRLREDAKATVNHCREMGLRVMLVTGDRADVARAIGESLGLSEADVFSQVLPAGKAEAIAQLQARGQRVAMVGDGINDAPALAQANVGMSLHGGTDVAVETAGIVLMRDSLMDVVQAIALSRATFRKIRQNLFWAFAYNTLGIPVAAGLLLPVWGVILNPAAAGALMAFSSVSVVTNSLLLRRHRFASLKSPAP
ncbi:heavy metal translocating P-type ATPase [Phormidium sp. CCY1219]|uniref:heavy metal translocating P-type ATPase n=1 Tax=Phormidium sp. CCY1219 TaxID=2886104 RepID=UPI002D1F72B6|nr:heavy metal translocating P-type ATPase [Phormidium sp. CCY1219]MEB3826468.1 heavy metal translocating P-type ATPase [Phormidium sp. CCY1219]